jgi:hypothetical protein
MITRQDALDIIQGPTDCPCDDCNNDAVNAIGRAIADALDDMAARIDNGPTFPLPPSVISELVRERAADLRVHGLDEGATS